MGALREIRRRIRHIVVPSLGAFAVGYFLVHTIDGDRGILAWISIRQQIQHAEATLAATSAERRKLESHVAMMRRSALDPDMLDEQVRRILGLVGPKEIVIFESAGPPNS